jgi:hypothetical protein
MRSIDQDKPAHPGRIVSQFKIEIAPQNDATIGATAFAVVVTIDDHETVLSFESRQAAERFAETERARLVADELKARSAPPA